MHAKKTVWPDQRPTIDGLSILLAFAIACGFALAVGLGYKPRPLLIGSAGEWVGGIGALSAAVVAVWFGLTEARRRERERREESILLTAYLLGEILDAGEACTKLTQSLKEWRESFDQNFRFPRSIVINRYREDFSFPKVRETLFRLMVLPDGCGEDLARQLDLSNGVLTLLSQIMLVLGRRASGQDIDPRSILGTLDTCIEICDAMTRNFDRVQDALSNCHD